HFTDTSTTEIYTLSLHDALPISTKHRNLETQNRNLELELASIGPFIELLPEAKKETIKEELVKKYFGQQASIHSDNKDDNDEVSINGLEKILKAILPFIKK